MALLNWKPVRVGKTYCSSACGGGCKVSEHEAAHKNARALARRMGKGWKPYVWENLGWHYQVHKGEPISDFHSALIEISPPEYGLDTFTVYIQSNPQFIVGHKDPHEALRLAVNEFSTYVNRIKCAYKTTVETIYN